MTGKESLLAALRTDRLYVESSETPDYTAGPFGHWLTCSECGWDGPLRREFDRPTRDWWRHPLLVCLAIRWRNDLRYWWSQRSWRRPISSARCTAPRVRKGSRLSRDSGLRSTLYDRA